MITEYCSHGDLLNFIRAHARDYMASMITIDEAGDEVFYKNMTAQQERLRRSEAVCFTQRCGPKTATMLVTVRL